MRKIALQPALVRLCLCFALTLPIGCAVQSPQDASHNIEVAFSPEAGAEALVLKVIKSARRSLRLAGYSFTSPTVVRALMDAKHRGVDVKVLIDDKGNRAASSQAAIRLIAGVEIPIRVISVYPIHHDKYIVVDEQHTETGSFNFSQAAARSNSENVLVIWGDRAIAAKYLGHWENRWKQGLELVDLTRLFAAVALGYNQAVLQTIHTPAHGRHVGFFKTLLATGHRDALPKLHNGRPLLHQIEGIDLMSDDLFDRI